MLGAIEMGAEMEPLQGTESGKDAIGRVKYTHDAMIDLVIAQPTISQNDLAKAFGYTPAWISRIFASDAFQARMAERRTEVVNPALMSGVEDRLAGLAMQSLDVLERKLQATDSADMALKCLEITTKAKGYGARQQNLQIQNNFVVALPNKVESADAWAAAHRGGNQVIEAQVVQSVQTEA